MSNELLNWFLPYFLAFLINLTFNFKNPKEYSIAYLKREVVSFIFGETSTYIVEVTLLYWWGEYYLFIILILFLISIIIFSLMCVLEVFSKTRKWKTIESFARRIRKSMNYIVVILSDLFFGYFIHDPALLEILSQFTETVLKGIKIHFDNIYCN